MSLRSRVPAEWSEIDPQHPHSEPSGDRQAAIRPVVTGPNVVARNERRQRVVHVVEYSRFPRRDAEDPLRVAYTQDRSGTGLGLDLAEPVDPGELLRITLRDIDGAIALDGLARVVWCEMNASGRANAGVELLREQGERRLIRARSRSSVASRERTHAKASGED